MHVHIPYISNVHANTNVNMCVLGSKKNICTVQGQIEQKYVHRPAQTYKVSYTRTAYTRIFVQTFNVNISVFVPYPPTHPSVHALIHPSIHPSIRRPTSQCDQGATARPPLPIPYIHNFSPFAHALVDL